MDESTRSAKGYRARGEQIRAEAEGMKDTDAKRALLHIADSYENLATRLFWAQIVN